MSAATAAAREFVEPRESAARETGTERGFAFGFLAMVPLFVVYEIVQHSGPWTARNSAEYLLTLPLAPLGAYLPLARALLLALLAAGCVRICFRAEYGLLGRVARVAAEGCVAALLLGPLLIVLSHALSLPTPGGGSGVARSPALLEALHHVSGAAFEEVLFRIVLQSVLFLGFLEAGTFFLGQRPLARVLSEPAAILAGAFVFAAAHLAPVVGILCRGGETFDAGLFTWRVAAGAFLGLVFRVRGPGVAAWTHALFNFALFVGAGPDVFL